jgi:hypothetical protein
MIIKWRLCAARNSNENEKEKDLSKVFEGGPN